MRIYSSLSPLDLHARGAELCRVLLLRDAGCMRNFGHRASPLPYRRQTSLTPSATVYDRLESFTIGPVIAPLDTCGFAGYDDGSLYHHAVQTYLQLCVRYPSFRDGKVRPAVRSSAELLEYRAIDMWWAVIPAGRDHNYPARPLSARAPDASRNAPDRPSPACPLGFSAPLPPHLPRRVAPLGCSVIRGR